MSLTTTEKIQRKRTAAETVKSMEDVLASNKLPKIAEFLEAVSAKVSLETLATIYATAIKDNSKPGIQRQYATMYTNLLQAYQKVTGDLTADELMKMADEQLEAILRDNYDYAPKSKRPKRRDGIAAALQSSEKSEADSEGTVTPPDVGTEPVRTDSESAGISPDGCTGEAGTGGEPILEDDDGGGGSGVGGDGDTPVY